MGRLVTKKNNFELVGTEWWVLPSTGKEIIIDIQIIW